MMRQPYQPVEINFPGVHRTTSSEKSSPGLSVAGNVNESDSRLAIGHAQ